MEEILKGIKENGSYEIKGLGVIRLLPRKKGRTFCGFSNKEGVPRYSKRLRFDFNKKLRDDLCV